MINAKRIAERVLAAFRSCFFSLVDFLPLAPTQTEIPDFVHDILEEKSPPFKFYDNQKCVFGALTPYYYAI